MRIAIPVAEGRLNQHFGHSRRFAVIDVNRETREIVTKERGVGVGVFTGVEESDVNSLVSAYLTGTLVSCPGRSGAAFPGRQPA